METFGLLGEIRRIWNKMSLVYTYKVNGVIIDTKKVPKELQNLKFIEIKLLLEIMIMEELKQIDHFNVEVLM